PHDRLLAPEGASETLITHGPGFGEHTTIARLTRMARFALDISPCSAIIRYQMTNRAGTKQDTCLYPGFILPDHSLRSTACRTVRKIAYLIDVPSEYLDTTLAVGPITGRERQKPDLRIALNKFRTIPQETIDLFFHELG